MTRAEYCEREGVTFLLRDLPVTIHGFSYRDYEGRFTVILNSRLSAIQNHRTADHEMEHIERGENEDITFDEYGGAGL